MDGTIAPADFIEQSLVSAAPEALAVAKRPRELESIGLKGTIRPHRMDCDEFWDVCDQLNLLELDKGEEPLTYTVFVRTLTGKRIEIDISLNTTVLQFMERVQAKEGIPPDQQRLIFQNAQLCEEHLSLARDYHVLPESVIHLVLRLRGGMFAASSGRYVDGYGRPIASDREDPPQLVRVKVYTDRMQKQEAWIPLCMIRYQVSDLIDATRKAVGPRAYLKGPISIIVHGASVFGSEEPPMHHLILSDLGVKPGCLIKFRKM